MAKTAKQLLRKVASKRKIRSRPSKHKIEKKQLLRKAEKKKLILKRAYILKSLIDNIATAKPKIQRYIIGRDRLKKSYRYVGKRKINGKKVDVFERVYLMKHKKKTITFDMHERNTKLKDERHVVFASTRLKTYFFHAPTGDGYFIIYPEKMAITNADLIHFLQDIGITLKRRNPEADFFRFEGMGRTENEDNPFFTCGGYMNHDVGNAIESFLTNIDNMSFLAPSGKEGINLQEMRVNVWTAKEIVDEREYDTIKAQKRY